MKLLNYFFILIFIFVISGCSSSSIKVQNILQTNGATLIEKDYTKLTALLIQLKKKLDLRNPNQFNKSQDYYIIQEIKNSKNTIFYSYEGKYLKNYDEYLHVAFSKKADIRYRNDFLILGLAKLLHVSYQKDELHQFTSLSYDSEKIKKLYYYLQVINWKMKTRKDEKGDYLFLTWQKNWQVELEKDKDNISAKRIKNLLYIKNKKETLFEPSNFSFEVIMNKMFLHVKNTSTIIGDEPLELSIDTMLSLVLFL